MTTTLTVRHHRPTRLPAGPIGSCQACGDPHVLKLSGVVWKHREWAKDERGQLVHPVCPGSSKPPKAARA